MNVMMCIERQGTRMIVRFADSGKKFAEYDLRDILHLSPEDGEELVKRIDAHDRQKAEDLP